MKVHIPTPLRSYTHGKDVVNSRSATVNDLLKELDRQYPGMRFRMLDEQEDIRPHIKVFVNSQQVRSLDTRLSDTDEVHIICALSGG
ncbi:MAG TPA: MoaD/ThiS family protein [Acidobacteriota bacterium]|nr:MoaD/ThiS family protein [Acidobacteriota bacterium]